MKIFLIFAVMLTLVPAVYSSDSPAEIIHVVSFNPVIPLEKNAYLIIPGAAYDFKIIKDAFLFSIGVSAHAFSGRAVKNGADLSGIYEKEWFVPEAEAAGRDAFYMRGEAGASFGWNVFSFFQKRQFIILTLAALFEREDIGGRVFSKLGRYSSCFSITSEVFELFGNQCLATVGYGSVSYSNIAKPGTLGSFIKAGLSMEFKVPYAHEDLYKRGNEKENEEKKEEGETVW
jgi:hypothetical protein